LSYALVHKIELNKCDLDKANCLGLRRTDFDLSEAEDFKADKSICEGDI